jgi:thiol-disulfide isomerase/thioredoxin
MVEPRDVQLTRLNGQATALAAYRGQVLLVDFWASWCAPCRMAFPFYADIAERRAAQGFKVVAISIDERFDDAKTFAQRWQLPFEVLHDPQKQAAQAFSVMQIPTSFVLDGEGRVRYNHFGFDPAQMDKLEEEIMLLLGELRPASRQDTATN